VTKNGAGTVTKQVDYTYDVYDRRIGKTLDSDGAGTRPATTERYVYDGDNIALVFSGNTLKQRYLYVDKADEFWAGFANVVTGGLSNQIREAIYGSMSLK
jgi:hypothetical protein